MSNPLIWPVKVEPFHWIKLWLVCGQWNLFLISLGCYKQPFFMDKSTSTTMFFIQHVRGTTPTVSQIHIINKFCILVTHLVADIISFVVTYYLFFCIIYIACIRLWWVIRFVSCIISGKEISFRWRLSRNRKRNCVWQWECQSHVFTQRRVRLFDNSRKYDDYTLWKNQLWLTSITLTIYMFSCSDTIITDKSSYIIAGSYIKWQSTIKILT